MEELGLLTGTGAAASVLVLNLEERLLGSYHGFAEALRTAGIAAEVFPEKKKLALQFAYAEKKGIPLALVCGEEEEKAGVVNLKDLRSRKTYDRLSLSDATRKAAELLQ
jgi:histidyl-tRNA synthetase